MRVCVYRHRLDTPTELYIYTHCASSKKLILDGGGGGGHIATRCCPGGTLGYYNIYAHIIYRMIYNVLLRRAGTAACTPRTRRAINYNSENHNDRILNWVKRAGGRWRAGKR